MAGFASAGDKLVGGNWYSIKSDNNMWLSYDKESGNFVLNSAEFKSKFKAIEKPNNQFLFQLADREYLSASDNGTVTIRENPWGWETFTVEEVLNQKYYLRSFHGNYLRINYQYHLLDLSPVRGEWEAIEFIKEVPKLNDGEQIFIKSADGRKLPSLSESYMEATFGESIEHSLVAVNNFVQMHKEGDTWPDDRLQEIFFEGLFRHYTFVLTGFHYRDNNCLYENLLVPTPHKISLWHAKDLEELYKKHGLESQLKWGPIPTWRQRADEIMSGKEPSKVQYPSEADVMHAVTISRWFNTVAEAFMQNKAFKKLGGDFQRYKVKIEKLSKALEQSKESNAQKELAKDDLYKEDRLEIDRQVLLFHWMKDAYGKASTVLKDSLIKDGCVPTKEHPLVEELRTYYPEYLFWPIYQPLVKI